MDCDYSCKSRITKYFNYGFFQGTNDYCILKKEWCHKIKKCPEGEK